MPEKRNWPQPNRLALAFAASALTGVVGVSLIGLAAPGVLNNTGYHDGAPDGILAIITVVFVTTALQTFLLAVPAFFLLRDRVAFSRRNAMLAGALCAALPSMAIRLWPLPGAGAWLDWLLTVFSPLAVVLLPIGALCGWLFWSMVASAPRRS